MKSDTSDNAIDGRLLSITSLLIQMPVPPDPETLKHLEGLVRLHFQMRTNRTLDDEPQDGYELLESGADPSALFSAWYLNPPKHMSTRGFLIALTQECMLAAASYRVNVQPGELVSTRKFETDWGTGAYRVLEGLPDFALIFLLQLATTGDKSEERANSTVEAILSFMQDGANKQWLQTLF